MKICQNCGNELKDDAKFCNECGSEVTFEEEPKAKFCKNCGFELPDNNIKFCPSCGAPTSSVPDIKTSSDAIVNAGKSPALAAILSFLIIGLGQVYIGLTKKGILLFVLAIISGILTLFFIGWIVWFIVWIYAIYDAYNSANKMNSGVPVQDTIDFNDL